MDRGSQDPYARGYNPFSHPLVWCLQDVLHGKATSKAPDPRAPEQLHPNELEETFVRSQEQRMAQVVMDQRRRLPPVLNDKSLFTKAAPFGDRGDQGYHSPCNRIGVNYSPASGAAASLLFEEYPQDPNAPRTSKRMKSLPGVRSTHSSSQLLTSPEPLRASSTLSTTARSPSPAVEAARARSPTRSSSPPPGSKAAANETKDGFLRKAHAGGDGTMPDEADLTDAVLRYHYYKEAGVDSRHVAPYREEWLGNALAMVPARPPSHVSQGFYDSFMSSALEEVHADYQAAMRKAILDYIISNPVERDRLFLSSLDPLLNPPTATAAAAGADGLSWEEPGSTAGVHGSSRHMTQSHAAMAARVIPASWRQHIAMARQEIGWTLQTLNPNVLELSRLWYEAGYATARLLDVESIEFQQQLPMQADHFRQYQQQCCEQLKSQLWSHWLPKCADIFRRLPPVFINDDSAAYYRAITTLQSNQLRGLVGASLQEYLSFFRRHPAVAQVDPQQDKLHWNVPPVFELELVLQPGTLEITFQPAFADAEAAVLSLLDTCLQAVAGIPRQGTSGSSFGALSGATVATTGASPASVPTTLASEAAVQQAYQEIQGILAANRQAPQQLVALLEPFLHLLEVAPADHAERFAATAITTENGNPQPVPDLVKYAEEIDRLQQAVSAVRMACTDDVRTGLYYVRCRAFKEQLCAAAEATVQELLGVVAATTRDTNECVYSHYQVMTAELGRDSGNGEEVLTLKKHIAKCNLESERLKALIDASKRRDDLLFHSRYTIPDEAMSLASRAYEWPKKFADVLREAGTKAATEHRHFENALKTRRREFSERVDKYAADVTAVEGRSEIMRREQVVVEVLDLEERLRASVKEAEEINTQEKMFGWAQSKYSHIAKLLSTLEPYVQLWTTINTFYNKYGTWMSGPFYKLNPEEVEAEVTEAFRKLYKLTKTFGGAGGQEAAPTPLGVAEEGKAKVASFQAYLPLISAICNGGLRERHWVAIADVVGFEIKRDEVTSLRRLLEHDLMDHLPRITELSDTASREYSIEKALDKMVADWEGLAFELGPWKGTGTYILKGGPVEEAQVLLDDHVVKVQAMAASPFSAPFADRLGPWETKLKRFQSMLDEWLLCQGKWLYLEPIFSAEEIMKQIPTEGAAFRAMDRTWRDIMQKVCDQPLMMSVAELAGVLESLQDCNKQLDVVEKGLNDFLDTKKMAFPRFYFLSNDELLEILAEAKDPQAVQPFVKKCFEAVKELVFEDGHIVGLVSGEGEKITFSAHVDPVALGAVEVWLLAVEDAIKQSLHNLARESLTAYAKTARSTWILNWPGQLVLNCSQVYWTREVTEAIQSGGAKGLATYAATCTSELNKIVALVRGQLTNLQRATCGALVVIDVHARDVTGQMAEDGVSDIRDFRWESQLRYYWEHNAAPPSGVPPTETIMVRMINAEALYGYEYLGNSGRLVITPLTDRCYRTLMGAIHMNLGGAPAGPAGTGKTETTKDLSKALAIQCVVFNCSDGLDYKAMGKFFKGLSCTGAWACFDEFNRIDLEVLSVVAQQVLTIIRAKAAKAKIFNFEGTDIPLKMTCNTFITMNPGYAGRSELPDNLKALFRDVAMMVPDYAMIAEIMLYSYGYLDARAMARKLVQTYRLCSEQLSSQDHYDYGMRAVMSVLRAAGNLKRSFPDTPEDVLMLRAINDVNLPKFLDQDVPLFNGILSDLFPGVELPKVDYNNLRNALVDNCLKLGMQPLESLLIKSIQLYEMIVVRHGLMLVGQSFGMKTVSYRILAAALSDLCAAGLNNEFNTKVYVLNPKSVNMGQLYGQEDAVSKEWTDGVLPTLFRSAARDTSPDRKWLIFDGPVDAIWIENMNTVLDDNKKLCLNSGEIIAMQGLMNLIFEVQDLAVASPATVSRCGMVYVQPDLLGWRPVLLSFLDKLPAGVTADHKSELLALFDWLLPPCIRVALKQIKGTLPLQEIQLACNCMRLLEANLDEFKPPAASLAELTPASVSTLLQSYFLFALVWSVGANTDQAGRQHFSAQLRKLLAQQPPADLAHWVKAPAVKVNVPFPEDRQVHDYVFDREKLKWAPWVSRLDSKPLDVEMEYSNIIVPTVDTLRYTYLLDQLVQHNMHCMLVGPTGTGKTAYVKRHLQSGLPPTFTSILMTFSAQTSANMTQDIIDGRLDKRRRGHFGPPAGKRMVVFVDDLNMPKVEEYGAQPPIELLRQWMDHGGWYDRKDLTFKYLDDLQFVAAMGPPGGGRNSVSNRYLRHFSVVSITAFDRDNLQLIFTALVDWWLRKYSYGQNIGRLAKPLVAATLDMYEGVQAQLLPTPAKSHYTFNLRDVSKVFQGLTQAGGGLEDSPSLVRLWTHEVLRVFCDRLVGPQDRAWAAGELVQLTETHFRERLPRLLGLTEPPAGSPPLPADQVVEGLRGLLFGNFMVPGADPRQYKHIPEQHQLLHVVTEYLSDMNATSKKPMQLVLFQFALEHIVRISRIISTPGGNALLVGLGGSGRQSLTRLAAYMQEMDVVQIEISKTYGKTEWHEDLRKVLKMTGEANKKVVFLFSDTQVKEESFIEDISNLLNTYEVPNLLGSGDLAAIFENIRPRAKAAGQDGTKDALYNFFVQEVRRNLHIVLSFSPVGSAFQERLRAFPSLVNCTTIDWFSSWPRDALFTVASNNLASLSDGLGDATCRKLPNLCVAFHEGVQELAAQFLAQQKRHYYITPTSYLELLGSYKKLLGRRQNEVMTAKQRYEVGLQKLATTEESVAGMQEELIALQPQLVASTLETEAAMEVIARESAEADKVKQVVSKEEASAKAEAGKVQAIKDECEGDLAEAMPALEAALKALDTLTKNDITEVKGMKSPPASVKLVLEAVCVLKSVKAIRFKDPQSGQMVDSYWEAAKKMLMEDDFLASLRNYDKDHIDPSIVKKIQTYVPQPDFQPETVLKASKAAYGLCCWVRAMESYDRVAKVVEPKRKRLGEAEAELEIVMTQLRGKQAELAEVLGKLAALDADLQDKTTRKEALEAEVEMCKIKLDRAQQLIAGLGGEKTRWGAAATRLAKEYEQLTGDVLLAAAQIAYLGPFTAAYRTDILARWVSACQQAGVPCSDRFKLSSVLGEPVKVRQWNIWGLPKDDFSTDNAITVDQGRRWPLCIDPQGAANKWIRAMEKDRGLLVIKLTDGNFLRTLENAIQFGKPVLLENVGEVLDAALEPLLARSLFKQGGSICIKLGDAVVEYSAEFKFYITTKLRNPHYAPELCTKVSLLNFMTTPEGLEDQLLGIVVAKERPDLEEEKNKLIITGAANKRKLQETEDEILRVLSSSSGNILEDEAAVRILASSKLLADEISAKQKIADETEAKIDEARAGYKPVAHHSSLLYFCVAELASLDPMYQYSLRFFIDLFVRAIADTPACPDLPTRLVALNQQFTFFLFQNVCRSLFEKDKLLFAMMLATKLKLDTGAITPQELRFFKTGGVDMGDLPHPNPAKEWIGARSWGEVCRTADLGSAWEGLAQHITDHLAAWKVLVDSPTPHTAPLPEPWAQRLDAFQRLLLLRALRQDKLLPAVTNYVADTMGRRFVEPQPFALEPSYADSTCSTPLIFVLSPGSDPMAALLKFADDRGIRVESVSLGQGQGPIAQRWITEGVQEGFWVVLQNCHLAKSFLPTLELLCETLLVEGKCNPGFRLWLTSYPSPIFPISILENGVKMTNEPPKGLRAGLLRTYSNDPLSAPGFLDGCQKDAAFRRLLFGLAFFHSVVQERRKFGPIGWNIPYEFNENDLRISVRQLRMFLDEYAEIPLATLAYTAGECNYGGKVTDAHDRHTLMTVLEVYYNERVANQEKVALSASGKYIIPAHTDYQGYVEYIQSLPLIAEPDVFGLHDNADMVKDLQESQALLEGLLTAQKGSEGSSGGGGGGSRQSSGGAAVVAKSPEQMIGEVASDVLSRLPPLFDIEAAEGKYPQDYYNSMNTVLVQELVRFNALLAVMHNSLAALGQAIQGLALMSSELDSVGKALFDGKVPALWLRRSFPSLKPLGSYVKEVLERAAFFNGWLEHGPPAVFWLPGFFFTQAFLTGAKQNFARAKELPIDTIDFEFEVMDAPGIGEDGVAPPQGVYCRGLFLEGARWDSRAHALGESMPKVLFTSMPIIWMQPMEIASFKGYPHYNCPMYKTTERRGVLSTTGHSTNFVLDVRLPSHDPPAHWTRRGVALLTSLSD